VDCSREGGGQCGMAVTQEVGPVVH
jgi:hypothetical protein